VIFELVTVHKTRLGSAFGVPGATAVLSIKIDIPENFNFVLADQALDRYLGFFAAADTDDPSRQLLHRSLCLGCFVQGMNRIVVSNRYHIIQQKDSVFTVIISLASAVATTISFRFVEQVLERFALGQYDIESLIDDYSQELDPYGEPGQNQGFMTTMAMKHDIPAHRLWAGTHIFGTGCHGQRLSSTMTPATSAQGLVFAKNKRTTASLLRSAGLPGAVHVTVKTWQETLAAVDQLGYPVVIKPYDRDNGQGVYAGIADESALRLAYDEVTKVVPEFLVERHAEGVGHRFTIYRDRAITVTRKLPATIVGDGTRTVKYLIDHYETQARRIKRPEDGEPFVVIATNHARHDIDGEVLGMLEQQGVDVDTVLAEGQAIQLRRRNNASAGGQTRAIDPATIHPDNTAVCLRAARLLGLDIAGVDFITTDITRSWLETGALICEVNAIPQIGYNHGIEPVMLDLFRLGSRIPVHLAIVDDPLPIGLARELASVYGANGLSTDQGLWLNGLQITAAWCDSYAAARSLIFNPEVSVAVCVMTKADVIEHGLPLDRWDNIVVENPDDVVLLVQAHSENIQPLKVNREQPMA
jgi:cyanophycin synthetase